MSAASESIVSIHPYFKIRQGKNEELREYLDVMLDRVKSEPACLYYDFFLNGDVLTCREAYVGGEGFVAHLENIGERLDKLLTLCDLYRLEVQGPAAQLEKLREPLADMEVEWFEHQCGIEK